MNSKFEVKTQRYLFKDKVNQRASLLPNVSNILANGTDKRVKQLQKCNILSNFHKGLARCCDLPFKKERTNGAAGWSNLKNFFDES